MVAGPDGGLTDEQMAAFARWTNLSETTFLLPPTWTSDSSPSSSTATRRNCDP